MQCFNLMNVTDFGNDSRIVKIRETKSLIESYSICSSLIKFDFHKLIQNGDPGVAVCLKKILWWGILDIKQDDKPFDRYSTVSNKHSL